MVRLRTLLHMVLVAMIIIKVQVLEKIPILESMKKVTSGVQTRTFLQLVAMRVTEMTTLARVAGRGGCCQPCSWVCAFSAPSSAASTGPAPATRRPPNLRPLQNSPPSTTTQTKKSSRKKLPLTSEMSLRRKSRNERLKLRKMLLIPRICIMPWRGRVK